MTEGTRTSEFWIAVLVIVAATGLVFTGSLDADNWQWAVGLVASGYAISRGLAKNSGT